MREDFIAWIAGVLGYKPPTHRVSGVFLDAQVQLAWGAWRAARGCASCDTCDDGPCVRPDDCIHPRATPC